MANWWIFSKCDRRIRFCVMGELFMDCVRDYLHPFRMTQTVFFKSLRTGFHYRRLNWVYRIAPRWILSHTVLRDSAEGRR